MNGKKMGGKYAMKAYEGSDRHQIHRQQNGGRRERWVEE